ncbi:conserved hypothetical protein [Mesorhizobium plurifarium]|uniref:Uncharacterized protein n=1 Tax=Mesorhizobium plurifarium TaxID=69974 RepID=A0A0K2VUV6_MESPL|nr:conserved hypothetical protein [Mesorhizobium plurifarium]
MKLAITNAETTEQFVAELAKLDVKLPLNLSETDTGVIVDAEGCGIITIDVNSERPDDQVEQIAGWIVMAVNTCGGFKAVRS